jgi:hypothetical protein
VPLRTPRTRLWTPCLCAIRHCLWSSALNA